MTNKSWLKAQVWVDSDNLEVAQSALLESNALGLEIVDGKQPDQSPLFNDNRIKLIAYFDDHGNDNDDHENNSAALQKTISAKLDHFMQACGQEPASLELDFSIEPHTDWQANFVKTCTTFMVEPNIYIVPSFEIEAFKKSPRGPLYLEMDPENAFGTGQHQTTKLCLTAISKLMSQQSFNSALDIGTGSGILAILMHKLGLPSVEASEIDEDALKTAAKNAHKNNVQLRLKLVSEDHQYDQARYDLIVANILAPVLIDMAPMITAALQAQAILLLSGILSSQALDVRSAYEHAGLSLVEQCNMDDWCALIFRS